jgi:hypothetical protein
MKLNLKYVGNGTFITKDEVPNLTENALYEVDLKTIDTRTLTQNRALHLWENMIAKTLNDNNKSLTTIIKAETSWSKDSVHELIIKPIIKALYNKTSTTKLDKNEFEKIIDTIVYLFGNNHGVVIPDFPNRDDLT